MQLYKTCLKSKLLWSYFLSYLPAIASYTIWVVFQQADLEDRQCATSPLSQTIPVVVMGVGELLCRIIFGNYFFLI